MLPASDQLPRKNYPFINQFEKFDKKINNFPCFICFENNDDSITLQCGHSFCSSCIQDYSDFEFLFDSLNVESEKELCCPVCLKTSSLKDKSPTSASPETANLRKIQMTRVETKVVLQRCDSCVFRGQTEIANLHCTKCSLNLCSACVELHNLCAVFNGHNFVHASSKENSGLQCEIHPKMSCLYFCKVCRSPACSVCVLHYHSEKKHNAVELKELLNQAGEQLKDLLKEIDNRKSKLIKKSEQLLFSKQTNSKVSRKESDKYEKSETTKKTKKIIKKQELNDGISSLPSEANMLLHSCSSLSTAESISHSKNCLSNNIITSPPNPLGSNTPLLSQKLLPGRFIIGEVVESSLISTPSEVDPVISDNDSNSYGSEEMSQNSLTYKTALSMLKSKIMSQRKSFKNAEKVRKISSTSNSPPINGTTIKSFTPPDTPIFIYVTTDDRNFVNRLLRSLDGWGKLKEFVIKLIDSPLHKKLFLLFEDAISRSKVVLLCTDRIERELDKRLELRSQRLNHAGYNLKDYINSETNNEVTIKVTGNSILYETMIDKIPLINPKLLWKFEKPKTEITESSMPSALTSLPGEEVTILAEFDSLVDANNRLILLDIVGRKKKKVPTATLR